tara:strand:- start:856 stop:1101 length:246 start_codon:yes stop_codon:yes gene_type:complete
LQGERLVVRDEVCGARGGVRIFLGRRQRAQLYRRDDRSADWPSFMERIALKLAAGLASFCGKGGLNLQWDAQFYPAAKYIS